MGNSLTLSNKAFLESILGMSSGYVLDFSNASFSNFFAELGIDIYDDQSYPNKAPSNSKANRMRAFWNAADNQTLAKSISALADYVEAKILAPNFSSLDFKNISEAHVAKMRFLAEQIRNTLNADSSNLTIRSHTPTITTAASVSGNSIKIEINGDVYNHIKQYLVNEDYFHAVEESYKFVREKLREITGKEKAHEAFSEDNYVKIFGREATTEPEKDFFDGVKFLNMSIQKLRNEKAHTLAQPIEQNLAIHYIALASLAYDLIVRNSQSDQ